MPSSHSAIPIGYFPKRIVPRPEWLKAPGVLDICSVSECISPGPENWINHWRHNDMWMYDTEEIARSIVGERHENTVVDMFAYRIMPRLFEQPISIEKLVFLRNNIFVPANGFFAIVLECQRQSEL